MECGQVLRVSHRVPVPCYVDVVPLSPWSPNEVVVGIRRARVELSIVIAMEGNIQDPAII